MYKSYNYVCYTIVCLPLNIYQYADLLGGKIPMFVCTCYVLKYRQIPWYNRELNLLDCKKIKVKLEKNESTKIDKSH